MYSRDEIEARINLLLEEKLFFAIRKIIIEQYKNRYVTSREFGDASAERRRELLNVNYKTWFTSLNRFKMGYRTIFALRFLAEREDEIRKFSSEELVRIKADYVYNDVEFSAYYPTHYLSSMTKEIEDCITELKNKKYKHVVDTFILKNTERMPPEPLTNARIKYSAFYLFSLEPDHVTSILQKLFAAGLITNPETSGWDIQDTIVEDIITMLNGQYGEEKVLQYKRKFSDKTGDKTANECIRPSNITPYFFPKNIHNTKEFGLIKFENKKEIADTINLYGFIFYMTAATQMKNSLYDTSVIEIKVGSKILKEQADFLVEGHENWELLAGHFINKISKSDDTISRKQSVVLPEIKQEEVLRPLDIYPYAYNSKRPPRYGVGRYITQILEKNSIGSNKNHDEIIRDLIDSKAVSLIKTMLNPQESAVQFIAWMKQYLPSLVELKDLEELEIEIERAVDGEIGLDSILKRLGEQIDAAFLAAGYSELDGKPSDAKIRLLSAIAKKYNLKLDESVYESNAKADMIIAKYPAAEPIKVGQCPACNLAVFQKEFINGQTGEVLYYFSCENFSKKPGGCTFSLWDSYIHKFFSDKALEFYTVEERAETLRKVLSKKKGGYLFNGFIAKNQKEYDAKIRLAPYNDRNTGVQKWAFEMDFVNKKKK